MSYTNPTDDPTLAPAISDNALPGDWIDRSQETYRPSPYRSRMVPPSGDVSREGDRIWPQPSLASKILVWGGMVAGAAAATAGTVLAVRAVVDGISGSDEDDAVEEARKRAKARRRGSRGFKMPRNAYAGGPRRAPPAPSRFADMDQDSASKPPQPNPVRADRLRAERQRNAARARTAQQHQPAQHGLVDGLNGSISDMTRGVRDALGTVTAAIEGFRSVAGQAGSIMEEFRGAADTVRTMFEGSTDAAPSSSRATTPRQRTASAADDMVDLRDTGGFDDPTTDRTHRL